MMRSLLQVLVCFTLCILLAAQQPLAEAQQSITQATPATAGARAIAPIPVALSDGTRVELTALDPLSAARVNVGSAVRFEVARDVQANGVTTVGVGTLVMGTVTKVRFGSARAHRGDELRIRLGEPAAGRNIRLQLGTISPPEQVDRDEGDEVGPGMAGPGMGGMGLFGPATKGQAIALTIALGFIALVMAAWVK